MNKYQRKIVKALMQRQFHFYEKNRTVDSHILDVAIFESINDYSKHKTKYQQALVECVQLNYITACRESRLVTSYLVTENGVRALMNWKERVITIVTASISSVLTTLITTYLPLLITYLQELLSKQ